MADDAAPYGGALGQKLTTAVLAKGFRYRFGQCVEGFPMPKEGDHTATVIWLHGLGDSGYGWSPLSEQVEVSKDGKRIRRHPLNLCPDELARLHAEGLAREGGSGGARSDLARFAIVMCCVADF
jgi:hypothetical protein